MKDDTRIALNFGLMGVAANALFVCGLLRNDFLMGDEADPAYKHYHTHIQRVEYLKTQELNFLMIASAFVIVFVIVNLICLFFHKEAEPGNKRITAAYIAGFAVNLAAVLASGAFVSSGLTSFCVQNAPVDAYDLMVSAHRLYIPIDIWLIALIVQVGIVLLNKKLSGRNKTALITAAAVPYILYPLFFL